MLKRILSRQFLQLYINVAAIGKIMSTLLGITSGSSRHDAHISVCPRPIFPELNSSKPDMASPHRNMLME